MIEALKNVVLVLSGLLVAFGALSLIAAWLFPKLLDNGFSRWMLGRKLEPSRANRTLISSYAILLGGYFLLSSTGHTVLSFAAFALWLPLGIVVLKLAFQRRR